MPWRGYLIAGAVLAASIGVNVELYKRVITHRLRAGQLEGQLAAMQERAAQAAAARREGERFKIRVSNVANSTEWGSVPVPDDVKRVLCERADCAPAMPKTSD